MPRAIWSGAISFGLVHIPVNLYTAVKDRTVRFHLLHEKDGVRLQQKMVCPADGDEVPRDRVVKGYEIGEDQFIVLKPEEIDALAPDKSRLIAIEDFVDLAAVDPLYYDHPYYLLPEENATTAYGLLLAAMKRAGKVAVARLVMHNKEYLAVLRPYEETILLETLRFNEEIVPLSELGPLSFGKKAGEREIKTAERLVASLTADFEPEKYKDEYRERVLDLIDKKMKGKKFVAPTVVRRAKVINLMEALEASLAEAKKKREKEKKKIA